jgi:hypothetical protein
MAQFGWVATDPRAGEEPPRLANGEPDPGCDVLLWRCEAGSYEEAMAIRNVRLGYAPYVPVGEPAPCPRCGAQSCPGGSAQCWNCDRVG